MPIQTETLNVPVLGRTQRRACSTIGPVVTYPLPGKPARWPIFHLATFTTLCVASSQEQALSALDRLDRQPIDWSNIHRQGSIEDVLAQSLFELECAGIVRWRGWKRSKWYPVADGSAVIYDDPQDRRAGCWSDHYAHEYLSAVRGSELLQQSRYANYVVRQRSDVSAPPTQPDEAAINRLLEAEATIVMLARSERRMTARDDRCFFWFEWRAVVLTTSTTRAALESLYPLEPALHPLRGADHPIVLQRRRCDAFEAGYEPRNAIVQDALWNEWRNLGVAASAWEAAYTFTGSDFLRAESLHPLHAAVVAAHERYCQLDAERRALEQPLNRCDYEARAEGLIRQAGSATWRAYRQGTLDQPQLQQIIAPIKAEYEAAKRHREERLQAITDEITRLAEGNGALPYS